MLFGGLADGMLEFAMSLIQQYLLGSRSWNYANEPLNIGGRTTVPFMLFWGLLCYLIVRFILPLVLWLVHLIDDTWHTRLATILLAWILIDAVGTLPAIFLYGQRANGVVFGNWFAQHIRRLSMTTSCACISRTCACESHRGSSGTISAAGSFGGDGLWASRQAGAQLTDAFELGRGGLTLVGRIVAHGQVVDVHQLDVLHPAVLGEGLPADLIVQ